MNEWRNTNYEAASTYAAISLFTWTSQGWENMYLWMYSKYLYYKVLLENLFSFLDYGLLLLIYIFVWYFC